MPHRSEGGSERDRREILLIALATGVPKTITKNACWPDLPPSSSLVVYTALQGAPAEPPAAEPPVELVEPNTSG